MAWTFTDAPATVPRDEVRVLVGDTDATDPLPLSDAQIAYFLTENGDNARLAAAEAADLLAAYYARKADTSNGKLSVSASQRSVAFGKVAARLRNKAGAAAEVFVGGLSISGKNTLAQDTDAVQPAFRVGMDDLPGSATAGYPNDLDGD